MLHKRNRLKLQSLSAPLVLLQRRRHSRRWQLTDESMLNAIEAVKGGISLLWAATTYDVPRSTLQHRMKKRVKHRDKTEPSTWWTSAEEELEAFQESYGKTQKEVKLIVEAVAKEKGPCSVRRYPLVGFMVFLFVFFWREDPTLVYCPNQWHPLLAAASPPRWHPLLAEVFLHLSDVFSSSSLSSISVTPLSWQRSSSISVTPSPAAASPLPLLPPPLAEVFPPP